MPRLLIALGSNSGDRAWHMEEALRRLAGRDALRIEKRSAWRETTPIGGPGGQQRFLNGAAIVESSLDPHAFLQILHDVEQELGRRRDRRWDARTIDLDLLLYGDLVMATPALELPHPRMAWRRFVLEPAAEIAGEMRHPVIGWTLSRLLEHLNTARPYVAIGGPLGVGKTLLAEQLCLRKAARFVPETIEENKLAAFYADPTVRAWSTELEILEMRRKILAAKEEPNAWSENRLAVSDFWFDQSSAYARAWLEPEKYAAFEERFAQVRREVERPKLLILLDASTEELLRRIRRRGRQGEELLTLEQMERIRESILRQAAMPDVGPTLKLNSRSLEDSIMEATAAIESME